jgi:magnesium chelatase family protein
MLVKTYGSAVYGVEAITITVEVNVNDKGLHYFIVGLPDNAVKESLQRVESAIKSNEYYMPRTKLVVNLAPADIKKAVLHLTCRLPLVYWVQRIRSVTPSDCQTM